MELDSATSGNIVRIVDLFFTDSIGQECLDPLEEIRGVI
jgi:hypothetical protein